MTGMKMFKLWMVVMLLGLLPVVSEAQEEINNAINVQLEYLKKYPKDKEALRKVSFLYLNKADYDQAIFMVDNCLSWVIMNGITMAL